MALFNHATKEVTAKLVYYGPGLCGKTTNLQWIHDNLSFQSKGKLISLATQTDRTLFFDFLPVELGTIRGMRTRMQIYTVPGQVFYESTRRMVLKGCDAVVFVADSQAAMLDANFESLQSLRRNLLANEIDPAVPMVLQYNKRDLPTALPVSVLNARLNPRNLAFFEAVAFKGPGVEETLRGITKALFKWLSDYYGNAGTGATTASSDAVSAPAAPAASPPERVTIRVPQPTVKFKPPADPPAATPAPASPAPPTRPTAGPATAPPRPAPPKAAPATVPPRPARPTPAPSSAQAPVARPAPPAPPVKPPPPAPPPEAEAPSVSPPAPAAQAPAEDPAETFVFVKPEPEEVPAAVEDLDLELLPEVVPEALPEEEPPATIRIKKQRVVISSVPADEPAATPAPAPAPAPAGPGGGAAPPPGPSAAEPTVFREDPPPPAPADPPPQGEGLQASQWLYLLDGTQKGPVDIEDLVDLVLTSIREDTKVWHPGLEGWVRANKVREIAEEIPPPLPIPGAARGGIVEEEMPDFDTVPPQFRTALIADEDEGFRKYLAMPLAAQGFTVMEAADGSAAWQLAVQNRPWLILADVSMPEVDGFEFCRRVRSHPMLSHTPLLFISGSDKYKERYRALQIGADDFLSKQMPIRELLMRIQLLLTKYSDLSDQAQAGEKKGEKEGAFEGRIEVFGAPALLQMCAQGRLSGLFTALAEDEDATAATMGFRGGEIVSANVGPLSGIDAAYSFLTWEKGSFKFKPGDVGEGEPLAQSVEHLLLEGCRLLDEQQRVADTGAPV